VTEPDRSEASERAEALVAQLEAEALIWARSILARVLEVAEDIWAEAKSAHDENRPPDR
jgi:hypothetical protein